MIDPGKGHTFFSRQNISKMSNLHHDLVYFCGDETIVPVELRRFDIIMNMKMTCRSLYIVIAIESELGDLSLCKVQL